MTSPPVVFLGTFDDPAGHRAAFFHDPVKDRLYGPMDLTRPKVEPGWEEPAPAVGPFPGGTRPGQLAVVIFYGVTADNGDGRSGHDGTFVSLRTLDEVTPLERLCATTRNPTAAGLLADRTGCADAVEKLARARKDVDGLLALHFALLASHAGDHLLDVVEARVLSLGPAGQQHRHLLAFLRGGLRRLATTPDCPDALRASCPPLAAFVAPAQAWQAGKRDTIQATLRRNLLGRFVSGVALFGKRRRPLEGTVEPLKGPFLRDVTLWVPLLEARDPEFHAQARQALENAYALPDNFVVSADRRGVDVLCGVPGAMIQRVAFNGKPPALQFGQRLQLVLRKEEAPEDVVVELRAGTVDLVAMRAVAARVSEVDRAENGRPLRAWLAGLIDEHEHR